MCNSHNAIQKTPPLGPKRLSNFCSNATQLKTQTQKKAPKSWAMFGKANPRSKEFLLYYYYPQRNGNKCLFSLHIGHDTYDDIFVSELKSSKGTICF